MATKQKKEAFSPLREKLHEIIFEADTFEGKAFDIALLVFIIASVIAVMLESVGWIQTQYSSLFQVLEWVFTIFFTLEYITRLYCVYRPLKYATSFFGIIDLLAILPAYLSAFVAGSNYLVVIRAMRLLRVFRILKLGQFLRESDSLMNAMRASWRKITLFFLFVVVLVMIIGSVMYLIEGGTNDGFDSIPRSIYWAIVTLTTVGYGDITPKTNFGQFLSAIVMLLGYAIIAVPTGIVSSEMAKESNNSNNTDNISTQSCKYCSKDGHAPDAVFCKYCGEEL